MTKEQLILVFIAVVFVCAGIFLYMVFTSRQQDDAAELQQETAYTFDAADSSDKETESATAIVKELVETTEVSKSNSVQGDVQKKNMATEAAVAPQTGPGEVALVISMIAACVVAGSVFIYTKKDQLV